MDWIGALDAAWLEAMRTTRSGPLTAAALVLSTQGGVLLGSVLLPAALALALIVRGHRRAGVVLLTATVATAIVTRVVKELVGAERPPDALLELGSPSWPSGHSSAAAALATVLALLVRRRSVVVAGALYVLLHMLARTYLGVHWVSDTVAGAAIGAAVAILVWVASGRPRVLATPADAGSAESTDGVHARAARVVPRSRDPRPRR